jgi:tetratricopeptide (TPR) repeat protein
MPQHRDDFGERNRERESRRMQAHNRLEEPDLPALPDHISSGSLPSWIKAQLRGLGEQNGELVGRHLAMVLECLEEVPELAYKHARAAADRAGRVGVAREYAGLTSYYTGRYAEAVRELRTYQRLSGEKHHTAILADALRGVGKPADAVELAASTPRAALDPDEAVELAIVGAGARADMAEFGAARAALDRLLRSNLDADQRERAEEALERIEALAAGADPASQEFVGDE